MTLKINDVEYDVEIVKKQTTKNIYIRVKDDLTIYVTCNTFTSNKKIEEVINSNIKSIEKMIEKVNKKNKYNNDFYYLGKKYDIIYTEFCDIKLGDGKVFINKDFDLNKWQKKEALKIFTERFDICYNNFSRKIIKPKLRLRKMTTRWGVCNTKTKVITLNTNLITKDISCIDYVIYHELSHLIEANHSNKFWAVVEENCKDYKKLRKLTNSIIEE